MNTPSISSSARFHSTHDFAHGLWRLADPKISLASFASMFVGACAAASVASIDWFWLLLTVLGIFAIEVAKNASGEIFDFDSGVDLAVAPGERTPFSGGKRVLVDAILTRGETIAIATTTYVLGVSIGLGIVFFRAPAILSIGIVGVLLAYEYHAPPLKLSYRGFGELAVALCYGPLIALGTFLVQVQRLSLVLAFALLPLGLLIAGFLWANEFPDYPADKSAGKNTLVVRLGRPRAARCFLFIELFAFALLLVLPLLGFTPWILLGLAGLFPAVPAALRLLRDHINVSALENVQRGALLAFLLLALGQGIGFLVGGPGAIFLE